MAEKIGVYICECGTNIVEKVNVDQVVESVSVMDNVALAKSYNLLCSQAGKEYLAKEIQEQKLTRLVIAACSPKQHELTFKNVLTEAGLNPYLFQMVNIREQCAWAIRDKTAATEKAKSYIRAGINRVIFHQPLITKEIDCVPDTVVVGAGVAGIEASLLLAQKGRKVYLVEKNPHVGGKVAGYEKIFPNMECASCMLEEKLDTLLHHERIEVLTYSEIEEVLGFLGNFRVRIKKNARGVIAEKCFGCAACFDACPIKVKNEFEQGLSQRGAIYIPFPGALPNVPVIDKENCLRYKGQMCEACQQACPFEAIDFEQNDEIIEVKAGGIVVATGFDLFNCQQIPNLGYGKLPDVYTAFEFERMVNSSGPTEGKVVLKNGKLPKSVVIIHCVGSRNKAFNEYCSSVCCRYSAKFARLIKENLPEVKVYDLFAERCLPGKGSQELLSSTEGVNYIRIQEPNDIEVITSNSQLSLNYKDDSGAKAQVLVDMVILAPAIVPDKDTAKIAQLFELSQDKNGFFAEEHSKLNPVGTTLRGVFIAGCAQWPKDIESSVAQGGFAAGKILSELIPGEKIELEVMVAEIDEKLCSGCKICISLCPYKAITYDKEVKISKVDEILCKGCGTCVAACPTGSAKSKHFTDEQIFAEIEGGVESSK